MRSFQYLQHKNIKFIAFKVNLFHNLLIYSLDFCCFFEKNKKMFSFVKKSEPDRCLLLKYFLCLQTNDVKHFKSI